MGLFLREARERNVSARSKLEQSRHVVQSRSGLSSGLTQACRDRASALVKAWETAHDKWQGKVTRVEKQLDKLEKREERLLAELAALTPRAVKTRIKKEITTGCQNAHQEGDHPPQHACQPGTQETVPREVTGEGNALFRHQAAPTRLV
ncbi:MAG: hypothetical protein ACXADA_09280 [Candidatus Hodarchaeales archaeon]